MKNGDLPMPSGVLQGGHNCGEYPLHVGLTKREQFAMAMAQGILSNERMIDNMDSQSIDWVAKRSASMADALLAELEKSK